MELLKSSRQSWSFRALNKSQGYTTLKLKPSSKNKYHQTADCYEIYSQSDYSSDGCEDSFLEWGTGRGGLYEPTLGFIMPGNENNVCKLIKSMYGLKQAPKKWNQKFNEVVLSNGYLLNQDDKCVYSKIDGSGKRVIICLYVDDMLIFGTNQVQVDLTKEFLSSRFSIKDMGKEDVILVSTPMDSCEKLMPNKGPAVSQLNNTEENSSTGGWVFLLGGGANS
nr:zinc finger, CCHC-type [Tanacetum cinerariifolium]